MQGLLRLSWAGKKFCPADDLADHVLPFDRHQMDPVNPFDPAYLFDLLAADCNAFFGRLPLGSAGHPVDDLVRNDDAGDVRRHVPGHTSGFERRDSGEYMASLMQAEVDHFLHPFPEYLQVVDTLRLDKIDSGLNLFLEPVGPEFIG